jgi:hypothetical protein
VTSFGGKGLPTSAKYTNKRNTLELKPEFSKAVKAITVITMKISWAVQIPKKMTANRQHKTSKYTIKADSTFAIGQVTAVNC